MKWSFRIARVAGIDIKLHVTFFLILLLGALHWGRPHGVQGALFGVLLMLLLFSCVVLHELGHSLVAQRFGLHVREIVLLPIGGVASLTRSPQKPGHELLIALAGPAVNVVLAGILMGVLSATIGLQDIDGEALVKLQAAGPSPTTLLLWLLRANMVLAVFNMIPALPMDGGRVFRALLAMRLGRERATQIAAIVAQVLSVGMGITGVLAGNFVLAFIAILVFTWAGQEQAGEQARTVLATLRVGDAYNRHALVLDPDDRVSAVVDYLLTSYQPDFAVIYGGALLGIVTRDDVLRALTGGDGNARVSRIMQREVLAVGADLPLDEVRHLMTEKEARVAAVYARPGSYLGLVSKEDIAEVLLVVSFQRLQAETARTAA